MDSEYKELIRKIKIEICRLENILFKIKNDYSNIERDNRRDLKLYDICYLSDELKEALSKNGYCIDEEDYNNIFYNFCESEYDSFDIMIKDKDLKLDYYTNSTFVIMSNDNDTNLVINSLYYNDLKNVICNLWYNLNDEYEYNDMIDQIDHLTEDNIDELNIIYDNIIDVINTLDKASCYIKDIIEMYNYIDDFQFNQVEIMKTFILDFYDEILTAI